MRSCLFLLGLAVATPALSADLPVTAVFAAQPTFAPAYHAMSTLPAWVTQLQATSVPVINTTIAGKPYLLGHLCKPHDCAAHQMEVLFTPDGHKAWGLLSVMGQGSLYQMPLGEPDPAILAALQHAYHANNPVSP